MTTAYYTADAICRAHDMGEGHPEQPGRLIAIEKGLDVVGIADRLDRRSAPPADTALVKRVHDPLHIDQLYDMAPRHDRIPLDEDTLLTPDTLAAARYGAGAGVAAVDAVMAGDIANAFCAIRPPGHHAEYSKAMGFCFFNNIAIAARHAIDHHGLERVAIVDFDVHHGNGTEDVMRDEPRVLFCSSYQNPLFPHTDDASIPGKLIKTPLRGGTAARVFRDAIERDWIPALHEHKPQLILVSAGFDAHRSDPLADLNLETEDFAWVTERILDVAETHCGGRVVSMLEGGYALDALAASAAVHVRTLLNRGA